MQDLHHIFDILQKNITAKTKVAVWVSGWPDSMFLSYILLEFFQKHNFSTKNILFIHLNHKVRKESDQEELFIKSFFEWQNFKIISRKNIEKNTENSLRKRRYQEFDKAMDKFGASLILLGHHFDDRVETTFLNILRGCGITGFLGIKEQESHHLLNWKNTLRPLLYIRKDMILDFCKKHKIPYVSDITNYDAKTSIRNKIRLEFLPDLFKQKGFESTIRLIYEKYDRHNQIDKQDLLKPVPMSQYWWIKSAYILWCYRKLLTPQNLVNILKTLHASKWITSPTIDDFIKFINTSSKGRKTLNDIIFFVSHDKLYIFQSADCFWKKTVDKQEKIDNLTIRRYPRPNDKYKWKTRNKRCITQKIPVFWRNFIPVNTKNWKIVSVERVIIL